MKRLITIELLKIWKSKSSRVLTISYFVILLLLPLIALVKLNFGEMQLSLADQGIFNFPLIWHLNTYLASIFKIFLAIIIVSMVANEYSYGTLKQNLIDGMSKKEFILSKFYTVILFSLISTLFVFIVSLILGLNYSAYTEIGIIFSDMQYLFAYFIKLVGFFSFCLFLGILIKRSAFALGFLIIWQIIELIFKYNIFSRFNNYKQLRQLLPLESMSNLIVEPFTKIPFINQLEKSVSTQKFTEDFDVPLTSVIIVLIWTSIFILMSYKLLQKRDL